jgi:hypothetical protein
MLCGYGANFAAEWGRAVRNIVTSNQGALRFTLAEDSKAANRWRTSQDGGMVTAGVGGDITGKGADLLIIDDPVKNIQEANSPTYRDSVWEWWTSTARTRLHPGGVILIIMTRWHEDDLVGRLTNPEWNEDWDKWHVINLPAIWEEEYPDVIGRRKGEALCPERYPVDALHELRRAVGAADWASLYMGKPARTAGVGNVYHAYDNQLNVMRLDRDPELPLFWSLDFNVDPMSSVIGQWRETTTERTRLTNEKLLTVEVLQEISLANSNTPEACHAFIDKTREYVRAARGRPIKLHIFGDSSGNQRNTSGTDTDWIIIRRFLQRYPEFRTTFHIPKQNPAVRDRTNAVNDALCCDGYRRLQIDIGCTLLRRDLQQTKWKLDPGGNSTGVIDKSDVKISHMSDALGYVIERKFGMRAMSGDQQGLVQ